MSDSANGCSPHSCNRNRYQCTIACPSRISTYTRARGEGFEPEAGQAPFIPCRFTVFDVISYYQVNPNLTLNLGLCNLFDTDYERYSDVRFLDSSDNLFDLQQAHFEQPGLNVQAGVTWQF